MENGKLLMVAKRLKPLESFFKEPINSILLGISVCICEDPTFKFEVKELVGKGVCLPYDDQLFFCLFYILIMNDFCNLFAVGMICCKIISICFMRLFLCPLMI